MKTAQMEMAYRAHTTATANTSVNYWKKFMAYCEQQQTNRLLWLAVSLGGHGTFFTIATLGVVFLTGNIFALLALTIFAMALVLITNLAALPTKITIPALVLSLLIDLGVMIAAVCLK